MFFKKSILLFLFFSVNFGMACTCIYPNIAERLEVSDAVFKAEIKEILDYWPESNAVKKVKFKVLNDFKGNLRTNIIYFSKPSGGCTVSRPKLNEKWLYYVSKNEDGFMEVTPCNPSISFSKKKAKSQEYKLNNIKKIKTDYSALENLNLLLENNTYKINNPNSRSSYNKDYTKEFGLYELTFDPSINDVIDFKVLESINSGDDVLVEKYYMSTRKSNLYRNKYGFYKVFKIPLIVWKTKF